jgi:hypothetical protein
MERKKGGDIPLISLNVAMVTLRAETRATCQLEQGSTDLPKKVTWVLPKLHLLALVGPVLSLLQGLKMDLARQLHSASLHLQLL